MATICCSTSAIASTGGELEGPGEDGGGVEDCERVGGRGDELIEVDGARRGAGVRSGVGVDDDEQAHLGDVHGAGEAELLGVGQEHGQASILRGRPR
ncbi:hypothetical protein ACFWFH_08635 [Streptomyces coelicoflavus]|uniref:hypothetical protein n=1 Tax=Streptomyces TaxID=1883 RepID=UPI00365CED17